jgi:hypothetical protein
MMKNSPYPILFLILLFACTDSHHSTENTTVVEIDVKNRKDYDFSYFFDTCYIVPLQTTDAALIGDVSNVILKDRNIFILDSRKSKSIFVYDWEGQLKTVLNHLGEGPGQYLSPSHMNIPESDSLIYITDLLAQKRHSYTFDGAFKESIKLDPSTMYTDLIQSNGLFYTTGGDNVGKAKSVNVYDSDFNLLKRMNISFKDDIWLQNGRKMTYFYEKSDGKGILYKGHFTNSIITIENDSITHVMRVNLSGDSFHYDPNTPIRLVELDERVRKTEKYMVGNGVLDSHRHLFVDIVKGDDGLTAVYHKDTGEAHLVGKLINDINGVVVSLTGILSESNTPNYFIVALFPAQFRDVMKYKKISSPYDPILDAIQLDDADNPVLFIYRFKQ